MENFIQILKRPRHRIDDLQQGESYLPNKNDLTDGLKFFAATMLIVLISLGFVALFLVDESEVLWK